MSNDKSRRILEKIVSHIDHTLEYCQGQTFESFMDNRMLQEACIFNLLQIGELSKLGLDAGFIASYPHIPWRQMYGMRNRLVHDYASEIRERRRPKGVEKRAHEAAGTPRTRSEVKPIE